MNLQRTVPAFLGVYLIDASFKAAYARRRLYIQQDY
jgi:hypothetical protein